MPKRKGKRRIAAWLRRLPPWVAPAGLSVLALGAFVAALASTNTRVRRPGEITPAIYSLALKWAQARGLPAAWVLATILAESSGRTQAEGDCTKDGIQLAECRSVGLMQVNWAAHGPRLQQLGIAASRDALFSPAANIEAGTLLLREAYNAVKSALAVRASSVPLDMLVRYAYTGPALAVSAINRGVDPADVYKNSARLMATWNRALTRAQGLA